MQRHRLLLVDDEAHLQTTLGDFLRLRGFEVRCADSAEKALEVMKLWTPSLVLLDIGMPGMGGLGFLKRVGSSLDYPKVPVIVLTARSKMEKFFEDADLVEGFLSKTCTREELLGKIGEVLARRGLNHAAEGGVRRRVILGENHKAAANAIRAAFESSGMDVEILPDGQAVLDRLIESPPELLVMKESLSGLNASLVAKMLSKMPGVSGVPVVLYDSYIAAGSAGAGMSAPTPEGVTEVASSSDPLSLLRVARRVLRV